MLFHFKQNCFLGCFKDPILDGTAIYAGDVPFWYNTREGKYTEFIGNPTGIIFVAAKRDHKFLLYQKVMNLIWPVI